jgi:hypothetical protein
LKAWLLERGWKLKRIHELDDLCVPAQEYDENLADYIDICEKVSGYYLSLRYPTVAVSELTYDELTQDLADARILIQALYPDEKLP